MQFNSFKSKYTCFLFFVRSLGRLAKSSGHIQDSISLQPELISRGGNRLFQDVDCVHEDRKDTFCLVKASS